MTNSKYYGYHEDIIDAIDKAQYFIAGMNLHQFEEDEKTQFACIKALEIIGEAANKFSKSFRKSYPNIPWQEIIGMRNKLIHDYMGLNSRNRFRISFPGYRTDYIDNFDSDFPLLPHKCRH